jgi:hypothetical protein
VKQIQVNVKQIFKTKKLTSVLLAKNLLKICKLDNSPNQELQKVDSFQTMTFSKRTNMFKAGRDSMQFFLSKSSFLFDNDVFPNGV